MTSWVQVLKFYVMKGNGFDLLHSPRESRVHFPSENRFTNRSEHLALTSANIFKGISPKKSANSTEVHEQDMTDFYIHRYLILNLITSPTEVASKLTIFSCGTATTLWPFISIIRWPTRTPPRSAMPPRRRLHICKKI